MKHFTLLYDENILGVEDYLSQIEDADFTVIKKAGREITSKDLLGVDILLCRSVTRVNESLLGDSSPKFIGSATAGLDHVDQTFLESRAIAFCHAPGANANAVAEWVICCLNQLGLSQQRDYFKKRIAIVGHGHVGKALELKLGALDCDICIYDPYLGREHREKYCTWEALSECDVVSFHVPYTQQGEFPTYQMIDMDFLARLKNDSVLINAARGEICDEAALLEIKQQKKFSCIWDVWKREPNINPRLLSKLEITTPHIAGYSFEAKINATRILIDKMATFFELTIKQDIIEKRHDCLQVNSLSELLLAAYQPMHDSQMLKEKYTRDAGKGFDALRKNYRHRHEFGFYQPVPELLNEVDQRVSKELGFYFE